MERYRLSRGFCDQSKICRPSNGESDVQHDEPPLLLDAYGKRCLKDSFTVSDMRERFPREVKWTQINSAPTNQMLDLVAMDILGPELETIGRKEFII